MRLSSSRGNDSLKTFSILFIMTAAIYNILYSGLTSMNTLSKNHVKNKINVENNSRQIKSVKTSPYNGIIFEPELQKGQIHRRR